MKNKVILHINKTNKFTHITINSGQNVMYAVSVKHVTPTNIKYFNSMNLEDNSYQFLIEQLKQSGIEEIYVDKKDILFFK